MERSQEALPAETPAELTVRVPIDGQMSSASTHKKI